MENIRLSLREGQRILDWAGLCEYGNWEAVILKYDIYYRVITLLIIFFCCKSRRNYLVAMSMITLIEDAHCKML